MVISSPQIGSDLTPPSVNRSVRWRTIIYEKTCLSKIEMKTEAIKTIDDLQRLDIDVNSYYSDSDYSSFIDEWLTGKARSLRFFFLQMNLIKFA